METETRKTLLNHPGICRWYEYFLHNPYYDPGAAERYLCVMATPAQASSLSDLKRRGGPKAQPAALRSQRQQVRLRNEHRILSFLAENPGSSQAEIARQIDMKSACLTPKIQRLHTEGKIQLVSWQPQDGKRWQLKNTEEPTVEEIPLV